MDYSAAFPVQMLSYKSKGDKWRKACVDWAASRTYFNYSPVRRDVVRMKVNYDLVNGIIHMDDVARILNPGNVSTTFLPDKIQHYPIINPKLNTLRGEEAARVFDWRVIVTNPYSISQIEEDKKAQFNASIQKIVEDPNLDPQQAENQLQDNQDYFDKNWQDIREIRGNELLRHYSKEQNFSQTFNDGFMDAAINNVEAYQTGIMGGEPFLAKLNPMKLRAFGMGYSNHLEDADLLVYEDYWSRGKVIEVYYDDLSAKDIKKISEGWHGTDGKTPLGAAGNENEAYSFVPGFNIVGEDGIMVNPEDGLGYYYDELSSLAGGVGSSLLPYDLAGNVRVIQCYWKSRRKILKVKSFDPITGEEKFDFYPETYVVDEAAGETAETLWVNEMWQGTKIGDDIYVGIRPCLVQHNSMSNPSRCHAGIIGTIYNINQSAPYSLVDMMKPYNYLYDAIHAKLVDMIATNWGKLVVLDLALKPKNWEVEKWIYFARVNKVLIKDSFREGDKGAALGKLAGGLNNASQGYVDADWGQSIQNYIELLQWAKDAMSDLAGINRQREGNTYNRETVGGIERAVLQSSYITDWLFQQHDSTKKRVLEAFLEQAKGALKGRSKKFSYILSDGSIRMMEVDGDQFAECDYGIVVDNSNDTQKLSSQLESIGQAGLQNGVLDIPTLLYLYTTNSIQDKIHTVEKAQRRAEQRQAEAAQQQQQLEQQKIQADMQMKQQELQQKDMLNQRDNQTKIEVANINAQAEYLRLGIYEDENNEELRREELDINREKLRNEIRKLDEEFRFKREELKQKKDIELKKIDAQKQIASKKNNTSK
ncbi:MAG: hypothetical protein II661_06745 [Bacteroidales bacterium]|nr:hypothetical protein [Bacteroidales bacterium]